MSNHWYAVLLKYLPEGIVSYISKGLVNKFIDKYADIELEGIDNIKNLEKPIIFICNHLSNADGIILNKILEKEDVTFVAGIKLSQNKFTNLGRYVVKTITITPNSADKDAMSSIIKKIKEGNNVLMFPEGTRSRTGGMLEARRGILLIQKLSKAKIVPIGIYGSEKMLPINDEGMEKEKFHHAKVSVKIGKPIEMLLKEKDEDRHAFETRAMKHVMGSIAELLPEAYRGVYK